MLNLTEIKLLELNLRDAAELFSLVECNREFLDRWLPWVASVRNVGDAGMFIEECLHNEAEGHQLTYKICYRNRIIGIIDLRDIAERSATFGYWVAQAHNSQGAASVAVSRLIGEHSARGRITRFTLKVAPDNHASIRVAEKCGFKKTATAVTTPDGTALVFEFPGSFEGVTRGGASTFGRL